MVGKAGNKGSLLNILMFRYLPYWPLFASLVLVCSIGSWYYLRYQTPLYEAIATILIKGDKHDVNSGNALESSILGSTNKAIENEIEVLQSKSLMKEVVKKLQLYAPVYEEDKINSVPAYNTSPVIVQVKDPENLKEQDRIYFSFDKDAVTIGDKAYLLDEWNETPFGTLMFSKNEKQSKSALNPLFFSLKGVSNVAKYYNSNLNVYPVDNNSSVVVIKIHDDNLQKAEDILNTLISVYTKVSVADKNANAVNTLSFLEGRIKLIENELDSLETTMQGYKARNGVVDLSAKGKAFLESVVSNDQRIADINVQLASLDMVENYVVAKGSKTGIVPSSLGVRDPLLSELLLMLFNSEVQYEKLKRTGAENNPKLLTLQTEIQKIRPSIIENIKNQRDGLLASIKKINASNSSYNSVLNKIPQQEKDLLDFSRRQSIKSSVYTYLLQKKEETALSLSVTTANSRVIDAAEGYAIPPNPNPATVYFLAITLGILISIAVVFIKDHGSTNILFRSEVESFSSIPIVAEIAKVKGNLPIAAEMPKHAFIAEQFRQLRMAIGLYGRNGDKKKLLVTSSIPGEGKSFISANLALSLAMAGKKTVLVDLDMRNPKVSELFGFNSSPGIAECLEGKLEMGEVINQTNYNHLFVVPAGCASLNPTELLLLGDLGRLFESLSKEYEYIIVDTCPIDTVGDAYVLARYCDVELFVVRHAFTPKSCVQLLDESDKLKAFENIAIVFNGVRPRGFMKKNYGYGYGYGYHKVYDDKRYAQVAKRKEIQKQGPSV